jgi:hypothetical protein
MNCLNALVWGQSVFLNPTLISKDIEIVINDEEKAT